MLGDAASASGVVIAGVLVATMNRPVADPVVSLLIAGLILYSSYGVLRESATVLVEGTPTGMDMPAVIAAIKSVDGVLNVLSAWTLMAGDRLRRIQTGQPQDYVYGIALGVIALLVWIRWPR